MASVNKVILLGNWPRPETLTTGGDAVTNEHRDERAVDKSGEKQERAEWHRVVLFGRQAEVAGEYLKKGRSVYIEGRLQTRKYTDKDGVEKYSTEIVADRMQLIGGGRDSAGGDAEFSSGSSGGGAPTGRRESGTGGAAAPKGGGAAKKNVDDFDDDIPSDLKRGACERR
jgi:single-strand DNA-binding protein